eukprot:Hpha_TRINITY_DN14832_c0_g1::TRINITY_DN14832_c0_g1_i1::g.169343::m.169343/K02912/RP-L32e, RPL32; large subunit ribosomal protein L32e
MVQILKKKANRFNRYHSDRYVRVSTSWRKPRGIDSYIRRRWRGTPKMARIGFGNDKRTRNLHPNGLKQFIVQNTKDLELLLMHNQKYAAVIGHAVGAQKRKDIMSRARELDVRVINAKARVRKEE